MSTKSKAEIRADAVTWRRNKALELKARGLNQSEIARELQVSEASISCDMQYLREQAKQQIKEYVTEALPQQYQVCLAALDIVIKRAFDMLNDTHDNRERLQAMELFKSSHLEKLELLSGSTTIDHALEFIRSKQQEQQHKQLSKNLTKLDGSSENDNQATVSAAAEGKQSVF